MSLKNCERWPWVPAKSLVVFQAKWGLQMNTVLGSLDGRSLSLTFAQPLNNESGPLYSREPAMWRIHPPAERRCRHLQKPRYSLPRWERNWSCRPRMCLFHWDLSCHRLGEHQHQVNLSHPEISQLPRNTLQKHQREFPRVEHHPPDPSYFRPQHSCWMLKGEWRSVGWCSVKW